MGVPGPSGENASDFSAVVEDVRDSVVFLETTDANGDLFFATGFYVDSRGKVLTATHNVAGMLNIVVSDQSGRSLDYRVNRSLNHLEATEIVPMGGPLQGTRGVEVADGYSLGEAVVVIGFPDNSLEYDLFVASQGVISAQDRARWGDQTIAELDLLVVDAILAPGSSGSPVFNGDGEAIAIVNWRDDNFGYAVEIIGESFN